jgi:hypothetical protein
MEGMAALRHDMRLLAGQPEAEAERLKADGAFSLVIVIMYVSAVMR